jgi:periplasmic mercuric ion binding protein
MFKRFALVMCALALVATPVAAQAPGSDGPMTASADSLPDVVLMVDGLACPFCAAGLEKKLKAFEATAEVEVLLDEGEVRLYFKADQTVSDEELGEAVKHAGFALRAIRRGARGTGG